MFETCLSQFRAFFAVLDSRRENRATGNMLVSHVFGNRPKSEPRYASFCDNNNWKTLCHLENNPG